MSSAYTSRRGMPPRPDPQPADKQAPHGVRNLVDPATLWWRLPALLAGGGLLALAWWLHSQSHSARGK